MSSVINLYFPSIFFLSEIENFSSIKHNLLDKIYEFHQENDIGVEYSNCGGWHSEDITDEKNFEPYVKLLENKILECLNSVLEDGTRISITEMWININKRGDFNRTHTHTECDFSGVIWINTCGSQSGNIEFENPNLFEQSKILHKLKENIKNEFALHRSIWMEPKEGMIVIFPSNMRHLVFPNKTDSDRISISFNISLT